MKYLFSNFDVALYAAVSVITKFALIVISLVETVYLPELLEYHKKERNKRNLFLLFSLSILGCLISYFLLPIL